MYTLLVKNTPQFSSKLSNYSALCQGKSFSYRNRYKIVITFDNYNDYVAVKNLI
jgi:hypothetical protein